MKLFLASEAKHPDTIAKLNDFVGGLKGKKIAYIPTANNGENPYDEWRTDSSTWNYINTVGAEVTPVVLEEYRNELVIEALKNKDIIWFAGGACGYLMYWARRCKIDKNINEILKDSVYVGSSAGSMVTSHNLDIVEWYVGETETGGSVMPGFGLVDFDIYPHYEDHLYDQIKSLYKGKKLYLLKNGEEIIVEDNKITVVGEERVITNG
ncbi:MAG: Type 1 glutamine amidotransferase-like domain-containing protein [Microgenomates group bacterium]